MAKEEPWLAEAKDLCRNAKVEIAGWGKQALVVYANSPDRAKEIATLLGPLGRYPVADPDDEEAGLLTLSRKQD